MSGKYKLLLKKVGLHVSLFKIAEYYLSTWHTKYVFQLIGMTLSAIIELFDQVSSSNDNYKYLQNMADHIR